MNWIEEMMKKVGQSLKIREDKDLTIIISSNDFHRLVSIARAAQVIVNKCDLQQELHWLDDLRRAFK